MANKTTCHTGNVTIYETSAGGRLMVGGRLRGIKITNNTLVIDMTATRDYEPVPIITGNDKGRELIPLASLEVYAWVNIPVKDGGVPAMTRRMWLALADQVKSIIDSGGEVLVACLGGHGRSGTAAAILLDMIDPKPGSDPVLRLRKVHCERAIESQEQVDYVAAMTGKTTTARPRPYHGQATQAGPTARTNLLPAPGSKNGKTISFRPNGNGKWKKRTLPLPLDDIDEYDGYEDFYMLANGQPCEICTELTLNADRICDFCKGYHVDKEGEPGF